MTAKVLLVGDSLAYGLAAPLAAEAHRHGVDLVSDGRTGTTARQWVNGGWLAHDIDANAPNVTLVSLGTNDATGDLGGFAQDVATLLDQATAKGGAVAWIGPPSFASKLTPHPFPAGNVDKMRQTLMAALSARGITLYPTDAHDYSRSADGIHMTASGYAAWAKDIADFAKFAAGTPAPIAAAPSGMSKSTKWLLGGAAVVLVGAGIYAWREG